MQRRIRNTSQRRALLEARLRQASGNDWIRGVDYQEQQVGELDRWILDELCPTRPVRVQHRSGKVWVCNSLALRELGFKDTELIDGLERNSGGLLTGRIVRRDRLLAGAVEASKGESKTEHRSLLSPACPLRYCRYY